MAESLLLFFDTNVVGQLKAKTATELKVFWSWIWEHHRYAIAPTVVAEILKSLRRDPETYLEDARRDLNTLRGPGTPIMLPLQGVFLGRTLFGIDREHPVLPATMMAEVLEAGRRLKRVVRRKDGRVLLLPKDEGSAIILDHIVDPIVEGEESMFAALENLKVTKCAPLDSEEWAQKILEVIALPVSKESVQTLAGACSAAYALQNFLWTQAAKDYNPKKHAGDWMDKQLPLYLAYETAVFVSCEKQLPRRIAGCGQEDRVWAFEDLWAASQA